MTTRSSRERNLRDGEVAGTPMITAHRASYAVAFTRAFGKSRLSSLGAPQTPRCPRSFQARTSAAEGGRLRDAFGAARRRPDRCRIHDQKLKTKPLRCLINSAGSSTYPTRKSVRTTRAILLFHGGLSFGYYASPLVLKSSTDAARKQGRTFLFVTGSRRHIVP